MYVPDPAQLASAEVAISRLQRTYADAVTRRDGATIGSLAIDDCRMVFDTIDDQVVEIQGAVRFGKFAERALGRFEFYVYTINSHIIDLTSPTTARGRTFAHEVGVLRDTGEIGNYWAVYHDDYALVEDRWLFSARRHQAIGHKVGDGHFEIFPMKARPD